MNNSKYFYNDFEHLRNLPVDTKVLVRDSINDECERRHFAYISDNGKYVFCFGGGMTSFTTESNNVFKWSFCEVYEE